jgi:hypothetical protein
MQSRVLLLLVLFWFGAVWRPSPSEPSGRAVDRIKQEVRHATMPLTDVSITSPTK